MYTYIWYIICTHACGSGFFYLNIKCIPLLSNLQLTYIHPHHKAMCKTTWCQLCSPRDAVACLLCESILRCSLFLWSSGSLLCLYLFLRYPTKFTLHFLQLFKTLTVLNLSAGRGKWGGQKGKKRSPWKWSLMHSEKGGRASLSQNLELGFEPSLMKILIQ